MSKTRKLMGLAAALAFAMVMLPASAFADATQYDLFVNGEQFTSEKLTIECGEGTATYDPATQTLALNNASIANTAGYGGIASNLTGDLTIALQGNNSITLDDNMGIMAAGNIEITGPGNLAINVTGENKDGISVAGNGNVSVRETSLAVNAPGGIGIASDGTVSFDNAQVKSAALHAGIDAINLIESGLSRMCRRTVAVTAPPEVRVRRIMARDHIPEDYARLRVQAQKDEEFYRTHCTDVLVNDCADAAAFEQRAYRALETILKEEQA